MPARPQFKGTFLTQQFTISVPRPDGAPIPVVVTKKRVKNFNLRVTSSGEVHAAQLEPVLDMCRQLIEGDICGGLIGSRPPALNLKDRI